MYQKHRIVLLVQFFSSSAFEHDNTCIIIVHLYFVLVIQYMLFNKFNVMLQLIIILYMIFRQCLSIQRKHSIVNVFNSESKIPEIAPITQVITYRKVINQ